MYEVTCKKCQRKYMSKTNRDGLCPNCRAENTADRQHNYYINRKEAQKALKPVSMICANCKNEFIPKRLGQDLCPSCRKLKEKEARMQNSEKYRKERQDVIQIKVRKGERDQIKAYAEQIGLSMTALIKESLRLYMETYGSPPIQPTEAPEDRANENDQTP